MITEVALRVRPLPAATPLRGLVRCAPSPRAPRRCAGSRRTGSRRTSRGSPTRTRRARRSPRRRGAGGAPARLRRARLPASGCLLDLRLGGRARRSRAGAARGGACCARRARCRSGARAGERVGRAALRRAAPARRPARPRRARRDARDGDDVVRLQRVLRRGPRPRCAARSTRRSSAATSRTSTRPARRCTSPCSRAQDATTRRAQWRRGQGRGDGARSSAPAARSPTTTRSAATTRRGSAPRTARSGSSCCARSRSGCDPAGIMNPGALLAAARVGERQPRLGRAVEGRLEATFVRHLRDRIGPTRPAKRVSVDTRRGGAAAHVATLCQASRRHSPTRGPRDADPYPAAVRPERTESPTGAPPEGGAPSSVSGSAGRLVELVLVLRQVVLGDRR